MTDTALSVPPLEAGPRSIAASEHGDLRPVTDTVPEGVPVEKDDINIIDQELERLKELMHCLSYPGFAPDGSGLAYKKFTLMNQGFKDTQRLERYKYLQVMELRGNSIEDTSCFGSFRYLVRLDLSNNQLCGEFTLANSPENLQELDLSGNFITSIGELTTRFLQRLSVSDNQLKTISGLSQCKFLTHLDVSNNRLARIQNLDGLPLKVLNLTNNDIDSLYGLEELEDLEELHLGNNKIASIIGLEQGHPHLRVLNLAANLLDDMDEIIALDALKQLSHLRLDKNPLVPVLEEGLTAYRLRLLHMLPILTVLDGYPIKPEEKVAAVNKLSPPESVVAALEHNTLVKRHAKRYAKIRAVDILQSNRLRPIVLCGPSSGHKRELLQKLLREYPHVFGQVVSHTTRKPNTGEEHGIDHYFISKQEMDALQKDGRFVEATNVPGSSFGVSYNAIDRITDEGKICLMDLDVAGMVALEKSEYQPHFIFFAIQDQDQPPTKPSSPSSPSNESDISRAVNYGKSSRGSSAKGQDPKSSDTAHWLMRAEAAIKEQFSASDFFSVSIVTDQSDRAHTTFRDFCLGVYWASIATEHS